MKLIYLEKMSISLPIHEPLILNQKKPQDITDRIKEVALGVLAGILFIPIGLFAENFTTLLLKNCGIVLSESQEIIQIFEFIDDSCPKILEPLIKACLTSYVTLFGPIIEECVFREHLYEEMQTKDNSLFIKVQRVFLNGIIFGLCHLSPLQGWTNVPIFVVTSLMGILLATLREVTGNIVAPSVAHITNNSLAMLEYHFS